MSYGAHQDKPRFFSSKNLTGQAGLRVQGWGANLAFTWIKKQLFSLTFGDISICNYIDIELLIRDLYFL
jgi:hypothetical protein